MPKDKGGKNVKKPKKVGAKNAPKAEVMVTKPAPIKPEKPAKS